MSDKHNQKFLEEQTQETKKKRTKKTIINVIGCCYDDNSISDMFQLNELSNQIEFAKTPPWESSDTKKYQNVVDEDLIDFKVYLARNFKGFEPPVSLIMEGVVHMAKKKAYHPVKQYLNSLTWDKKPRLDHWLTHAAGVTENVYTKAVARKVLVAAVARVMTPGVKFDHMMILEGGQGIGKSTLVRILGGDWFDNISLMPIDKDTIDAMQGKWILEVDELVGFNRHDLEKMKGFISRPIDRARLAYQRTTKPFPRQSIFIGTTNPLGDNTYFRDETGNRRYWPITCGTINQTWLRENRDQLFAEALVVFKNGEKLFLDDEEAINIAKTAQDKRLAGDPWVPYIVKYIADKKGLFVREMTVADIAKDCLEIPTARLTKSEQTRIGIILSRMGILSVRREENGQKITVYKLNPDDVEDDNQTT